jgi:hypothetical protein
MKLGLKGILLKSSMAAPYEALAKCGAEGRTRTDMVLPPRDFESRASAISPLRHIFQNTSSEYCKRPNPSNKKASAMHLPLRIFPSTNPINKPASFILIIKPPHSRPWFEFEKTFKNTRPCFTNHNLIIAENTGRISF